MRPAINQNPTEFATAAERARELFVTGLRNAHAMERQAEEILERQSETLTDYPDVQRKVRQHLGETREQIQRLEQCLRACGESESVVKDTALAFMGNLSAMSQSMAGDAILKNTFADDGFEHYEIATYKSLLTLCERANVPNTRQPLQTSLREEESIAYWLDEHVPDITLQYLNKAEREGARAGT